MGMFKKKPAKQEKTSFAPRKPQSKPFWALVVLAISVIYVVALLDFSPSQSKHLQVGGEADTNLTGTLGTELAYYTFHLLGAVAWVIPLLLFWTSYLLLFRHARRVRLRLIVSAIFLVVSLAGLATLLEQHVFEASSVLLPKAEEKAAEFNVSTTPHAAPERKLYFSGYGGLVGKVVFNPVAVEYVGTFGTSLLILLVFVISVLFLLTDNLQRSLEQLHLQRETRRQQAAKARELRAKEREQKRITKAQLPTKKTAPPIKKEVPKPSLREDDVGSVELTLNKPVGAPEAAPPEASAKEKPKKGSSVIFSMMRSEEVDKADKKSKRTPKLKAGGTQSGLKILDSEVTEKARIDRPKKKGNHTFPTVELLNEPSPPGENVASPEEHLQRARDIARILEEFNVKVEPAEVQNGPVITRYEIVPAPGVRVEKILNLDKNLALGLRAEAVRILAPVPGKGTVGIEVPNPKPLPVTMREIVESKAWADSKAEIPVVLGKDVTGRPIVEDLTRMPHMLIAGSTGSGKTVCINAVIASLLYHSAPEDLRFLMVDPKVVEMQVYNKLPHMLIPVVTEPKKVPGALKYLIGEMERRYQIFAKLGVRNIAGFNAKIVKDKDEKAHAEEMENQLSSEMTAEERAATSNIEVPRDLELEVPDKKMHYIVCIIDELADLMMVAPQDIETGIARLAQLARAAGIHLILATQRPSVNVITGVIKANLPTRVSFKVASKVDSRTILDQGGAEALIGKGDMLFVPPGTSNLVRAQGAFVSDDEINNIVDFLNGKNGEPEFAEEVQQQIEAGGEEGGSAAEGNWDDELVPDAIGVLKATKRASTSMLQRRLKIGYNRAARIMEILEDEGIVGPENGSSPREILKDLETL